MLTNVFCFRNLIWLCLSARILISSGEPFKPGKPLTKEEFRQAARLKVSEDENHFNFYGDILIGDTFQYLKGKNSSSIEEHLWPKGVVPYVLDASIDKKLRILIARAIQVIQNDTCVRFVPKKKQKDFLTMNFYSDGYCSSKRGHIGGNQVVNIDSNCIIHELMHALGFTHEHSRMDRDDYVTVMWGNIKHACDGQFEKIEGWYSDRFQDEKYDYSSVMHYGVFTCSIDPEKPVLIPTEKNVTIGQTTYLSPGDIRKINIAYRC